MLSVGAYFSCSNGELATAGGFQLLISEALLHDHPHGKNSRFYDDGRYVTLKHNKHY